MKVFRGAVIATCLVAFLLVAIIDHCQAGESQQPDYGMQSENRPDGGSYDRAWQWQQEQAEIAATAEARVAQAKAAADAAGCPDASGIAKMLTKAGTPSLLFTRVQPTQYAAGYVQETCAFSAITMPVVQVPVTSQQVTTQTWTDADGNHVQTSAVNPQRSAVTSPVAMQLVCPQGITCISDVPGLGLTVEEGHGQDIVIQGNITVLLTQYTDPTSVDRNICAVLSNNNRGGSTVYRQFDGDPTCPNAKKVVRA